MLYDILKAKLPMIAYSLGIAIAVMIVRTQQLQIRSIIDLTLVIFGTLSLLKIHAPKVFDTTEQGIGMQIGNNMVGGRRAGS